MNLNIAFWISVGFLFVGLVWFVCAVFFMDYGDREVNKNMAVLVMFLSVVAMGICSFSLQGRLSACPSCGERVNTAYCAQCGAPTRTETELSIPVCPSCGAECETAFCGACGAAMPEE